MIRVSFVIGLALFFVNSEDMSFSLVDYDGDISQKILRLYYKDLNIWKGQPHACYGSLVDWKIGLFPCSCVSHSDQTDRPWNHHVPPVPVQMVDVNVLEVGIMMEEYEPKYGNDKVKIVRYIQNPDSEKCSSDYTFDWVALELERRINFSILMWFASADFYTMGRISQQMVEESAGGKPCKLLYWESDPTYYPNTNRIKNETHFIRVSPVNMGPWETCSFTVCPSYEGVMAYKINVTKNTWQESIPDKFTQSEEISGNHLGMQHRSCVSWRDTTRAICEVVPGTPVICSNNRLLGGIIGTITNATTFCPVGTSASNVAPINLVAPALSLVSPYLRIAHAPGYNRFFNESDVPDEMSVRGLSFANDILPFPLAIFALSSFYLLLNPRW